LHWAAVEKPAIFWSIVIGSIGPVLVVTVPPIRNRLGDPKRPEIPLSYPSAPFLPTKTELADANIEGFTVPPGPRQQLKGYDD